VAQNRLGLRRTRREATTGHGTVIADCGVDKLVEVADELGEGLDFIWVPTEQLRLIWKCPSSSE
jgi:hypothetical protein